jgi:hypothetical protein
LAKVDILQWFQPLLLSKKKRNKPMYLLRSTQYL